MLSCEAPNQANPRIGHSTYLGVVGNCLGLLNEWPTLLYPLFLSHRIYLPYLGRFTELSKHLHFVWNKKER